jgi:hypothetical protein
MSVAPAVPILVPLTNGTVYSFGHVTLQIAGLEFTGGFKSIKRSRKRNREMVRSNSPDPVGKTLGENEYQASAEMYLAWWDALQRTVENNLGPGYGDQSFTILVSYVANGFLPIQHVILNCTIDSTEADDGVGTAALTRMVEFNPTKILFNGIDDLEDPLQGTSF